MKHRSKWVYSLAIISILGTSDTIGIASAQEQSTSDSTTATTSKSTTTDVSNATITTQESSESKPMTETTESTTTSADRSILAQKTVATTVIQDAATWMPDENLRKEVQGALGQQPLTKEALATLTTLDLKYGKITNITGLEYASQLTKLDLSGNAISDLTPLHQITSLTTLLLKVNKTVQVADLTPLVGLPNLTTLSLVGNNYGAQPDSLAVLTQLPTLTSLDLQNTKLTQLPNLTNLTNLRSLSVMGNKLTDVSAIFDLSALTNLTLSFNKIQSVEGIQRLKNLQVLGLGLNPLEDVSPLQNMTTLTSLTLDSTKITSAGLASLHQLTKLESLVLDFNKTISDLTPLANMTNLQRLVLNNDNVSDLTPIAHLKNLRELELTNNQIKNIIPLAELTNLKKLTLRKNQVMNVTPLRNLTQLTTVDLKNQVLTVPTIQLPVNKQSIQPLPMIQDINGQTLPLSYQSGHKATIKDVATVEYEPLSAQAASDNTYFAWANTQAVNPITASFSGSIIQPLTLAQATNPNDQQNVLTTTNATITVYKGDGSKELSVASNYIGTTASLTTQDQQTYQLTVTATVPESFGPDSIQFANGVQTSKIKVGQQYLLTYQFTITAADLTKDFPEAMHVVVNNSSFNYDNHYTVYFSVKPLATEKIKQQPIDAADDPATGKNIPSSELNKKGDKGASTATFPATSPIVNQRMSQPLAESQVSHGATLPQTGVEQTSIWQLVGSLLVALSASLFWLKKKHR